MKLVCQNPECERLFDGNPRAKYPARYCPDCAAERKREADRAAYRKNKAKYAPAENGYILEKDPSDAPLTIGMSIPVEQHNWMVKLKSYTPGTIIRQGETRKRIDKVKGKLVEVVI